MLPLSDGLRARRFPIVNVSLIVANFAVWLFYELPHLNSPVFHASFYPCTVNNTCHGPESWGVSWITVHVPARKLGPHPRQHALPGRVRQERRGRLRAAPVPRLLFRRRLRGNDDADADDARCSAAPPTRAVPNLGASGAIAAVLGAFFVLYPNSTVRGLVVIFPVQLSAWFFLGFWFLYQLLEANFGIFGSSANGGGVAFFAHVGGFLFGVIITLVLTAAGRIAPQDRSGALAAPA